MALSLLVASCAEEGSSPVGEAAGGEQAPARTELTPAKEVVQGDVQVTPVERPPAETPAVEVAEVQSTPDRSRPSGWSEVDTFGGQTVHRVLQTYPDGDPRRVLYYLPGPQNHESLHGPEWQFFPNGTMKSMQFWDHGVLSGAFRAWWPSGVLHWDGQYLAGERHGTYRQYHKTGDLQLEFNYQAGVPEGMWREYAVGDALILEENYDEGLLHGRRRTWNRVETEGEEADVRITPVLDETYERGQLHGLNRVYWIGTGVLQREGSFSQGLRSGEWHTYHVSGEVEFERHYEGGKLHGRETHWIEGGQRVSVIEYEAGAPHGLSESWYPDGSLQAKGSMVRGKREGEWLYLRQDGSPNESWSGTYRDDEKVDPDDPPAAPGSAPPGG